MPSVLAPPHFAQYTPKKLGNVFGEGKTGKLSGGNEMVALTGHGRRGRLPLRFMKGRRGRLPLRRGIQHCQGNAPLKRSVRLKKSIADTIELIMTVIMKTYYAYIMASKRNGTLYTGVTGDLAKRVVEHKEGKFAGFTKTYGVKLLVWFQQFSDINDAIRAEKKIKSWSRAQKIALIEKTNPNWIDQADYSSPKEEVLPF